MATTVSRLTPALGWPRIDALAGPFIQAFGALLREIRVRRSMNELACLDDALLHDMGLDRSSIEDAVRHGRTPEAGLPILPRRG